MTRLPVLLASVACAAPLGPPSAATPPPSVTRPPAVAVAPATTMSPATVMSVTTAAPGCPAPTADRPSATGVSWTQRRFPPDQLSGLSTGAGVTVAVIDSGVDPRLPQLAGRVRAGTDFLDRGGDGRRDCAGHGTAVASIIAAAPRAGTPVRGLAPDARILPVRVSEQQMIDGRQSGRISTPGQLAQAIRWSVAHGATVLNLSVVLYRDIPAVRAAVGYAVSRDVVVVAAAGNLGETGNPVPYPASYPGVLGVGAIGPDGTRPGFSQVGSYVDVLAPGVGVPAATPGGQPGQHDGTSYAAPFVSATAALLRQYRPTLTAGQIADRILAGADPGSGDGYGRGVLNPYRAITETAGPSPDRPTRAAPPLAAGRPEQVARDIRQDRSRHAALLVGSGAAGLTTLVLLAVAVVPRLARRRWSPGCPHQDRPT